MITEPYELLQLKEGTILLVDDQPEQIDIIHSILDRNFIVKASIRGESALQICSAGGIDLVLLDVMMPDMDGYEVCLKLKSNLATREIPVIFLTSKDSQDAETLGLELGAVDFIRKPSSPSVIYSRCRSTIAYQRAQMALREKNTELKEMIKIREDMQYISQHDLKGPLSAIIGIPELLISDDNLTEKQKVLIKTITRSGYTLLDMINRSLDLVKMENNTYNLNPDNIDLLAILKQIVDDLEAHIRHKNIDIIFHGYERNQHIVSFFVFGEKMLCYPLFYNLILNAIEASSNGGKVDIFLMTSGGFGIIRVTNSGEVPIAIRDHFFDKYVTYGKKFGTGLGTYSAWISAKTQGGRIDADMSQCGATSIIVSLPCSAVNYGVNFESQNENLA
ncbi:MAG: response regulator [Magnetococcales bacterium]|nr:response regulator [Magnetococcales bacterium]MBF0148740.1 response regulator [Magnetococcales bacterium]